MHDRAIIILEPTMHGGEEHACLYLERSVMGIVSLLNMFNMARDREYKLMLVDDDGGIITETISDNYKMFRLPKNFSLNGEMYAELYEGECLLLAGRRNLEREKIDYCSTYWENGDEEEKNDYLCNPQSENCQEIGLGAREWAEETGQMDLYNESSEFLRKFHEGCLNLNPDAVQGTEDCYEDISMLPDEDAINRLNEIAIEYEKKIVKSDQQSEKEIEESSGSNTNYWSTIEDDFEKMFKCGKRDEILEAIFKNSCWSKHKFSDSAFVIGKIYKKSDYSYYAMPDIVAVAVPMFSYSKSNNVLGKNATFVRASRFDDFGFMVLLQEASTGRAIKIIKNKG